MRIVFIFALFAPLWASCSATQPAEPRAAAPAAVESPSEEISTAELLGAEDEYDGDEVCATPDPEPDTL